MHVKGRKRRRQRMVAAKPEETGRMLGVKAGENRRGTGCPGTMNIKRGKRRAGKWYKNDEIEWRRRGIKKKNRWAGDSFINMCKSWASIFFLCILNNCSRETEVGGQREENGEDSLSGHEVSSCGLLSVEKQRGVKRVPAHACVRKCAFFKTFPMQNVPLWQPPRETSHFKDLIWYYCPAKSQNCKMCTSIFFHSRHSGAGRIYRMTNRLSAPLRCKLVQLYCWTISTDAQGSVSQNLSGKKIIK